MLCLDLKVMKLSDNSAKAIDPKTQLWTDRYAPQTLKEICGNKGQVEKLQQWLKDWCNSSSYSSRYGLFSSRCFLGQTV